MSYLDLLLLPENLTWAWRKAKRMYATADNLHDQGELAEFDLGLEANLLGIWTEFMDGSYRPRPLRLLPQPKKPDGDGNPRMRQSFHVSVRDQVAWIAVANALGPSIDRLMPAWSYGHRLYRAAWFEDDGGGKSELNIGPYRHAGGHMYRRFKHSWPLFRRHLCLTARKMSKDRIDTEELDKGELRALGQADDLPYLRGAGFWRRKANDGRTLYHASLDLSKFYPKVSTEAVLTGFDRFLPGFAEDAPTRALVAGMLEFSVTAEGLSEETTARVEPETEEGRFDGIPTGLMAAGFLSNVAMLPVDREVDEIVRERRAFAHFRFVDDHAVLAYEFDVLCGWIREYEGILAAHGIGAPIAPEKFDPKELRDVIYPAGDADAAQAEAARAAAVKECRIDGAKPVKLMTRTLAQVSALAAADFDLLTDPDKSQRLEQLEWLLLADIPDREIRSDTRAAFAAGRIAAMAPTLLDPTDALVDARRRLGQLKAEKSLSERERADIVRLKAEVAELSGKEEERRAAGRAYYFSLLFQAFAEHPDKVRLFIRLLDYCRATGHDGLKEIAKWMRAHAEGDFALLRAYLGALAMHFLARQLPQAARDACDPALLHSERDAAADHLRHAADIDLDAFLDGGMRGRPLDYFRSDAATALGVGAAAAAATLGGDDRFRGLARLAKRIGTPDWAAGTAAWRETTRRPLGVWTHWTESLAWPAARDPSPVWVAAAEFLDPSTVEDRNSLRRYPRHLPGGAWEALATVPGMLSEDDAGWLLEAATANPGNFATLSSRRRPVVRQVRQVVSTTPKDVVTLTAWVERTSKMDAHDPRTGEWTALEIVRQLVAPLLEFPATLDPIDRFHPAMIGVPAAWLEAPAAAEGRPDVWTWEGWCHKARTGPSARPIGDGLRDYRFGATAARGEDAMRRRLRTVGQILWGLLRKDFAPPGAWNVRGQEMALAGLVGRDLETLAVSSATVAILEACLLPRGSETSLMASAPGLFGMDTGDEPNDVDLDAPAIPGVNVLLDRLVWAQRVLVDKQVTVLRHRPRQLVPLHVRQVGLFADKPDFDGFEGEWP